MAVFYHDIDSNQCKTTLRQLEADLRDQTLIIHTPSDWTNAFREAEKVGARQNESIGCRSVDLFHIGAAIDWGADLFLTFDARQKKMAKAVGFAVNNSGVQ
jgi:hypothetical protein